MGPPFYLVVKIIEGVGESSDAVDKAAGDGLLPVYNAADIVCKLIGRHHELVILLAAYIRVAGDKADDALLNSGKIVIRLRNTDNDTVKAHRMDRHGERPR